jgi:hypothetical protein
MLDLSLGSWRIWYGKVWAAVYLVPRDTRVLENLFWKIKNAAWWVPFMTRVLNSYHSHIYMPARLGKPVLYCLWALSVVKLCRPLGIGHAVKIKIHVHSTYLCYFYPRSTIHIYQPIYSTSILEVQIHIYSIQIHPENSSTPTLGVNFKQKYSCHSPLSIATLFQ